jgi:hypothetical protein
MSTHRIAVQELSHLSEIGLIGSSANHMSDFRLTSTSIQPIGRLGAHSDKRISRDLAQKRNSSNGENEPSGPR